jgi:hypothetical protein
MGPFHQAARRFARDAALGDRSAHRDPELQERSVAAAGRGREDRQVGRRRRADGERRRHAEAARVRRLGSLAHRQAGSDRHLSQARRAARGRGLVGQLLRRDRPHRGSVHQGDREQAREDGRRASSPDVCRRCRRQRRQQRRRQQRRSGRVPQRVRGRQERRLVPRGHRPSAEGGIEDQVRFPLPLGRSSTRNSWGSLPSRWTSRADRRGSAAMATRASTSPEKSRRSSRTCTRAASANASS